MRFKTQTLSLAATLAMALSGCGSTEFGGAAGTQAAAQAAPQPDADGGGGATTAPGAAEPPGSGDAVRTPEPGDEADVTGGAAAGSTTAQPIPADKPTDSIFAAIDSGCADNRSGGGIFGGIGVPVSPKGPTLAKTAPADCRQAVEFNNFHGSFDLDALSQAGSRNLKLEVDLATYEAPDRLKLFAVDAAGKASLIMDTCRLKTSSYGDPTHGDVRPPEDSIRSFRPVLPKGTVSLRFDFTGSHTPQYMRVVGLCDFGTNAFGGSPDLRTGSAP